ncbi:MAG: hypothetical protein H0T21_06620 [Gemmatimonadaceae bacterium]|nr:hypothetical protein [Gemmatimonadaceae bacterium]
MRRFLRDNGLTLVLLALFAFSMAGQIISGHRSFNIEQVDHGNPTLSTGEYLRSAHFVEATFENWESEFLQMGAFVLLTIWLFQKGSSESKKPEETEEPVDADPRKAKNKKDAPWPVRRGGWMLRIYETSLSLALFLLFLISFVLHAAGGAREFSEEAVIHGRSPISTWEFMHTSRFWFESFQNWQSEFLSIAILIVLSIFLRQRGSPQSKPVAAPNDETED